MHPSADGTKEAASAIDVLHGLPVGLALAFTRLVSNLVAESVRRWYNDSTIRTTAIRADERHHLRLLDRNTDTRRPDVALLGGGAGVFSASRRRVVPQLRNTKSTALLQGYLVPTCKEIDEERGRSKEAGRVELSYSHKLKM